MFKKYLLIVVIALAGCTSALDKIPDASFESFEYHRNAGGTTATIIAEGAEKTDDGVIIDSLQITEDFGPFMSLNMKIKGYLRVSE